MPMSRLECRISDASFSLNGHIVNNCYGSTNVTPLLLLDDLLETG